MRKFESFQSRLEAILVRHLNTDQTQNPVVKISGTTSATALAMLLTNNSAAEIDRMPHVVVCAKNTDCWRMAQTIQFFDSQRQTFVFSDFDVSPYSGLYPKPQLLADRLSFLAAAQGARPGQIFITSIAALMQKTLPFGVLANHILNLQVDQELPADFPLWLQKIGYQATPVVEDTGQFCQRGGIFDIFSPAYAQPVRIELFGDTIQSLRFFNAATQSSIEAVQGDTALLAPLQQVTVIPPREIIWIDENLDSLITRFRQSALRTPPEDRSEFEETLRSISRATPFAGVDFLLPYFYPDLSCALDHFSSSVNLWMLDPHDIAQAADTFHQELKEEFISAQKHIIKPALEELYFSFDQLPWPAESRRFELSNLQLHEDEANVIDYKTASVGELSKALSSYSMGSDPWLETLQNKLKNWSQDNYRLFLAVKNKSQIERLRLLLEKINWQVKTPDQQNESWFTWLEEGPEVLHMISRYLPESVRLTEEKIIFLRDEDLLGRKVRQSNSTASDEFARAARRLSFGDLNPGDCVVHVQHGVGVYEGLRVMNIGGADSEFIQIAYKDKDKLYLPVYRIGQLQKYAGAAATTVLDKLGGSGWEKTKSKVRSHLRDLAAELLQIYAKRRALQRPSFSIPEDAFSAFQAAFPFDETDDQIRAINDICKDLTHHQPMDRLICGDVGFGKTEVAMRAAFIAASNKKQVAILAPTTVLTFQHFETFKKRFASCGFTIGVLNRFVSPADVKKTLQELRAGKVDILIGTHRLLSKDVVFADLGLMIVDEEQKFGVAHKERIRKMRSEVDTLAMSATPIPRTLNMSLMGIRDLSLINTAPVDRLPTRTFISKWDNETIRRAILNEVKRGGQVYFIHNRVQSIYGLADELRTLLPEVRMKVGHGQMDEHELEKTMVQFFNHEIDVLLCTTIVESGMDVPKANTMFIDQAHAMGLSQLYQLRGRVGRSKQRAYCYLLLPKHKKIEKEAQERLKVLQENTALGSGIRIAQYDLELRGAGEILGEEQSGHINSVGYELYMDLLNEAVHELKGEPLTESLEPEINLKIPALIPDTYISDIRLRLSFYKALADIRNSDDLDKIDAELRDQFGELPEPTQNLLGLMLIRSQCRELGVRDLSAGLKNISLIFTAQTRLKAETVIGLAMRQNKKYSLTPDNRLNVRMNLITWPAVHQELEILLKL